MEAIAEWEAKITHYIEHNVEHTDDASHDFHHFKRVWTTAQQIIAKELQPVDGLVVMAACYFHDIVVLPKNHPQRHTASTLAAAKTREILQALAFPQERIDNVCHAVMAHSFSAGIEPETIEAKVVQDADRMEALGAIGLARCFYTGGVLKHGLFDPVDPLGEHRELDDSRYSLDHFEIKLLQLPNTMKTEAGREMAGRNADYLRAFRDKVVKELRGDYS